MLKGYEAQVYLDIREVEDADFCGWARLHAELNGGGVADPQAALEDMLFGALYAPFRDLLSAERIEDAQKVFTGEASAIGAESLKAVERFVRTAKGFLKADAGADGAAADTEAAIDTDAAVAGWEKTMLSYAKFFEGAEGLADKSVFARYLRRKLTGGTRLRAYACADAALELCAVIAGAAVDDWHIDRKTRECLEAVGIEAGAAARFVDTAKALLKYALPAEDAGKTALAAVAGGRAALDARSVVQTALNDEVFRRLIGVNEWDGVEWFNKEAFEATLYRTAFLCGAYADIKTVAPIFAALSAAEQKSGYRVEGLISN
jgi:hypothetical protein